MNNYMLSPYIRKAVYGILPPHFRLAKRIIFDYEIIYVNGGGARLIIEGEEYICQKGDVVFLRPGISHELMYYEDISSVKPLDFVQPHIHFDAVYNKNSEITPICFKDREGLDADELALIQEDIIEKSIPYVFVPCKETEFGKLFFDILSLYKERPPRFELSMKIRMLELLSMIFEQFDVKATLSESAVNDPAMIVKNYIDNNYLSPVTLEGLQNQFYINKYTLIRNFNRLYKKSPIAYYHERRIEYAKEQLSKTARSVSSIAAQMNTDSYSFNRFFRTHTGVSPSDYRKENR